MTPYSFTYGVFDEDGNYIQVDTRDVWKYL